MILTLMITLVACGADESSPETTGDSEGGTLVVYSGRNEELVGPLIEQFKEKSGIEVQVKYGSTSEMAATILEEGNNSPADIYYGQDAGALGALSKAGRFEPLPDALLSKVESRFRSPKGEWIGTSGRARVVVYNTEALSEEDLPESILDYTDPKWKGQIGWAPANGSFQAFVTALRMTEGEEVAREWLKGIQANEPKVYPKNTPILEAVGSGEIAVGFVNHYYLLRKLDEVGESYPARNQFSGNSDIGGLINVAGVGIVNSRKHKKEAQAFVEYLLSEDAQAYFRDETSEYPLVTGVQGREELPPLSDLQTPDIDLSDLDDLEGTLELLQELGIL